MPDRTTQIEIERAQATRRLLVEDGATGPGEVPVDHIRALEDVDEPRQAREVADAHAERRGPPDFAGDSSGGGPA